MKDLMERCNEFVSSLATDEYRIQPRQTVEIDVDLNGTMTSGDLVRSILCNLSCISDYDITEEAMDTIDSKELSREGNIRYVVSSLKGLPVDTLKQASRMSAIDVPLYDGLEEKLRQLYPLRLNIYTGIPQESAEIYVETRIAGPYFGERAEQEGMISVHGSILEYSKGELTGRVLTIRPPVTGT